MLNVPGFTPLCTLCVSMQIRRLSVARQLRSVQTRLMRVKRARRHTSYQCSWPGERRHFPHVGHGCAAVCRHHTAGQSQHTRDPPAGGLSVRCAQILNFTPSICVASVLPASLRPCIARMCFCGASQQPPGIILNAGTLRWLLLSASSNPHVLCKSAFINAPPSRVSPLCFQQYPQASLSTLL